MHHFDPPFKTPPPSRSLCHQGFSPPKKAGMKFAPIVKPSQQFFTWIANRLSALESRMAVFMSAEQAVNLVKSGDTVTMSGFVGMGHPEEISAAMEKKFLE